MSRLPCAMRLIAARRQPSGYGYVAFKPTARYHRRACALPLLILACGILGCGKSGIDRYHVQGPITYRGEPIPAGHLVFEPDPAKGNRGPGVMAFINQGHYETLKHKGIVGGPHIVRIYATDGKPFEVEVERIMVSGKDLFPPVELAIDFPKADCEQAIEVPPQTTSR